jgi:hypothetical protein
MAGCGRLNARVPPVHRLAALLGGSATSDVCLEREEQIILQVFIEI